MDIIMKKHKCKPEDLLSKDGLKTTRKRLAVLEAIIESDELISAKDLHERLSHTVKIDLATVYRILRTLHENGAIRSIKGQSKIELFEVACQHNQLHPHFYCKVCGRNVCLEPLYFDSLKTLFLLSGGHDVESMDIAFTGICAQCK